MTAPMPRCSCGCGATLTPKENRHYSLMIWPTASWRAKSCLAKHRAQLRKSKPKDGEKRAVAKGLVPAPRIAPAKRRWSPAVERRVIPKRGTCDRCGKWRNRRRHETGPDEALLLCKECVP